MVEFNFLILFIEDDLAHAEIFKRNLKKSVVQSTLFHLEDGQQALDYLFRKGKFTDPKSSPRPRLIITDLRLPKIDGIELIRIIRSDKNFSSIPIVILSTSESEKDIAEVYSNKANSYLVKPLECSQYLNLIETFGNYWLNLNHFPSSTL